MIMMTDIYYKYSYQSFYNRPSGKKSRWFSKKPTETKEQETPTTTNEKQTLKEQTLPKIDETSIEHDMESERVIFFKIVFLINYIIHFSQNYKSQDNDLAIRYI